MLDSEHQLVVKHIIPTTVHRTGCSLKYASPFSLLKGDELESVEKFYLPIIMNRFPTDAMRKSDTERLKMKTSVMVRSSLLSRIAIIIRRLPLKEKHSFI